MAAETSRRDRLLTTYVFVVTLVLYVPMIAVALASISRSRFFVFPIRRTSFKWYSDTFASLQVREAALTSVSIALLVALISVVLALLGALAYARYDWKGKKLYQQLLLVPIFFPQAVLGLALQIWFSAIGVQMTWTATVFAHLVWIAPIVTLIIAIQAYGFDSALEEAARDLGATRWQVFRDVTLPLLGPGVFSGFLFAVLLSWGNFPLSYFTSGADVTIPEWLYGKMIGGYTPMVPAVGFLSIVAGGIVLVIGLKVNQRLQKV